MGVNDNNKLYSWSITCTDYSQIHISKSQSQLRLHNILDDAILFWLTIVLTFCNVNIQKFKKR